MKRIQTLPEEFDFGEMSYFRIHKLIGNAVPRKLAYHVGMSIKKALDDNVVISDDDYLNNRKSINSNHSCQIAKNDTKPREFVIAKEKIFSYNISLIFD